MMPAIPIAEKTITPPEKKETQFLSTRINSFITIIAVLARYPNASMKYIRNPALPDVLNTAINRSKNKQLKGI